MEKEAEWSVTLHLRKRVIHNTWLQAPGACKIIKSVNGEGKDNMHFPVQHRQASEAIRDYQDAGFLCCPGLTLWPNIAILNNMKDIFQPGLQTIPA